MAHGLWNLGEAGLRWWQTQGHLLPTDLRFFLGYFEIGLAVTLWIAKLERYSLVAIMAIMFGAFVTTIPNGFLYKNGGCEVPLLYTLIAFDLWRRKADA
ncbi:MAG: hypothetical protein ABIR96_09750 [Bdellovibrionota bacterium]